MAGHFKILVLSSLNFLNSCFVKYSTVGAFTVAEWANILIILAGGKILFAKQFDASGMVKLPTFYQSFSDIQPKFYLIQYKSLDCNICTFAASLQLN